MATKKSNRYQDVTTEMAARYYKVSDLLNKAPDIDEDDIISFITIFLATLKSTGDDYYQMILKLAEKINIKFDGETE